MAQTFQRQNKTRREDDTADMRKTIQTKQAKNLTKHRNAVYDMVDDEEGWDGIDWDDEEYSR